MERTLTLDDFAEEVDITHPLTARRVPVVQTPHNQWKFHVALVIGGPEWAGPQGIEPEDWEIDQLCVYLEKHMRYYNDRYRKLIEDRGPFDLDSTVNTFTFRKTEEEGWQYNMSTWRNGPTYFPSSFAHPGIGPLTLEEILDRINTFGEGRPMKMWLDLKTESGKFPKEQNASRSE